MRATSISFYGTTVTETIILVIYIFTLWDMFKDQRIVLVTGAV